MAMQVHVQAHLSPSYKLPRVDIDQQLYLEEIFERNKNPHPADLVILAAEVGLSEMEVRIWFQHRLACWRQSQGLPANGTRIAD